MKKIVIISLGLSLAAFGMGYEKFKQYTLTHAKRLQKQRLSLAVTEEKNAILLRSQNPTLTLETSRFNPDLGNPHFGYALMATQSIRTGHFYDGLEAKADASTLLQQAYVTQGKAVYLKMVENLYTEYVYQSKLLALLEEEYRLSNRVTKIVEERYTNGSENRVAYLQAKTNTLALKTQIYTTKQAMNSRYYQLLSIAGMKKSVALSKKFIYPVSAQTDTQTKTNPQQQILHAKTKLLESQIHLNESRIENFELYGGIEDEPGQAILRVGVNVALPLFNNKSEEKRLAQLQHQQLLLDKEQLNLDIHAQTMMLTSSIKQLMQQYYTLKRLKSEQKTLNKLLQEGYKIAQGSIFVMMNAQNKLIQTQKSLLQTEKMINTQKIELRFIQGQYND